MREIRASALFDVLHEHIEEAGDEALDMDLMFQDLADGGYPITSRLQRCYFRSSCRLIIPGGALQNEKLFFGSRVRQFERRVFVDCQLDIRPSLGSRANYLRRRLIFPGYQLLPAGDAHRPHAVAATV